MPCAMRLHEGRVEAWVLNTSESADTKNARQLREMPHV